MLGLILSLYVLSVYLVLVYVILLSIAHIEIMCKHDTCKDGQTQRLAAQSCSSFHKGLMICLPCVQSIQGELCTRSILLFGGCVELLGLLGKVALFASVLDHVCAVEFPQQECSVMWQIKCCSVMLGLAHIIL